MFSALSTETSFAIWDCRKQRRGKKILCVWTWKYERQPIHTHRSK